MHVECSSSFTRVGLKAHMIFWILAWHGGKDGVLRRFLNAEVAHSNPERPGSCPCQSHRDPAKHVAKLPYAYMPPPFLHRLSRLDIQQPSGSHDEGQSRGPPGGSRRVKTGSRSFWFQTRGIKLPSALKIHSYAEGSKISRI